MSTISFTMLLQLTCDKHQSPLGSLHQGRWLSDRRQMPDYTPW